MFFTFANAAIEAGHDVFVALTTHEGEEFRIGGFATIDAAQTWIDQEAYPNTFGAAPLRVVPHCSQGRNRAA